MSSKERRYNSTMSSVQKLEDRCNFDELNIPGKLQSLEADVDTSGVKVTVAIYEQIDKPVGVGNLKIVRDDNGKDSAWILTINTRVTISRS
jgi:hypothetical protein